MGAVESRSTVTGYSCNDKDNETRIGRVYLEIVLKLCHRREAQRLVSHWIGRTLSSQSESRHCKAESANRSEIEERRLPDENLVVRTDANWTGQRTAKIKRVFSCVVVTFDDHVIDVVCAKQDVVALNEPESEFNAMTTGGAFSDLQVESDCAAGKRLDQRIWHLLTPWCWPTEPCMVFQIKLQQRTSNLDGFQGDVVRRGLGW